MTPNTRVEAGTRFWIFTARSGAIVLIFFCDTQRFVYVLARIHVTESAEQLGGRGAGGIREVNIDRSPAGENSHTLRSTVAWRNCETIEFRLIFGA